MMELAGVASQAHFDVTQAACPIKLPVQQRKQVSPGLHAARITVGIVLLDQSIDGSPRNVFHQPMKNDMLVLHGVDPFRVQLIRNSLETSRINAVHSFKHKPCRTLVDLFRPSTTWPPELKTWMASEFGLARGPHT